MAVTHQDGGVLDTSSAELIVVNRLMDGDYTVVESDELKLTALEATQVRRRIQRPNHAIYWVQVSPETGEVRLNGEPLSFRQPAVDVELGIPVTRLIISNYRDTGVAADMVSLVGRGVRGVSKNFETTLEFEGAGDKTLLELLQDWLTAITRHLQTGELAQGLLVHDQYPLGW